MSNNFNQAFIECRNVSYRYPDNTLALNRIDLQISAGEKIGIIGPNGAGKSTFLNLLNGVRQGTGTLIIGSHPVNKHNLNRIKALVGIVFQNPDDQLFCPTILEDIAFGPLNLGLARDVVQVRVNTALLQVGLEGYGDRSSVHLSYGERKLAAIASVLSMQPEIIAMDEPTSNLDPLHRRKIIQWIQKSTHTCVVTSHDLDMILDTCNRVYIFNQGSVVAEGPAQDILTHQHLLESNDLELPLKFQNN